MEAVYHVYKPINFLCISGLQIRFRLVVWEDDITKIVTNNRMLRDNLLAITKRLEIGIKFAIKFCNHSNGSSSYHPIVPGLMTIENVIVCSLSHSQGQI